MSIQEMFEATVCVMVMLGLCAVIARYALATKKGALELLCPFSAAILGALVLATVIIAVGCGWKQALIFPAPETLIVAFYTYRRFREAKSQGVLSDIKAFELGSKGVVLGFMGFMSVGYFLYWAANFTWPF